jgi:hypothetical protein
MKMKKILKGVSVLLIAIIMVLSTVAVTANTVEEKDELINITRLKPDNPNPSYSNDEVPLIGPVLFSQKPNGPEEYWNAYLSEMSQGVRVHDEYWGVNEQICDIHWWGFSLFWNGAGWDPCDPEGMCFEIIFWDSLLGNPVCVYDVCPPAEDTGVSYDAFTLYYWETILDPCCDQIPNGWVSIQSYGSDCYFLWMISDDGDWYAYQEGSPTPDIEYDVAFELTGEEECEPSIDVEKYVKGKCGEWVDADTESEALDLPICTDATFKIVIHNNGECCGPLFEIYVADLMHDSLKFISADPEPEYFYYYPPYYVMYWYFPGPLDVCNTIEIYVTAHVEGPECSIDENYVEAIAQSDCEPYSVYDFDYAYVHAYENDPPSEPNIDGPTKGGANTELCWKFHSTDPEGDPVRYVIDWGDGTTNTTDCVPSCTPFEVCHTYAERGTYTITAVAIDCCWGAKSANGTLDVEIPRNRAVSHQLIQWFSLRFPNLFPILRHIFGI